MDVVAYKRPPIVGLPLYMKSLQGSIQGLEERAISWGETLTNLGLNEVDLCVLYVCYVFIYMLLRYAKTHQFFNSPFVGGDGIFHMQELAPSRLLCSAAQCYSGGQLLEDTHCQNMCIPLIFEGCHSCEG